MSLSVLSCVGLLLLSTYGTQALNCRNKVSMLQEQSKCFQRYNISLSLDASQDIQTAIQNDPSIACQIDKETYANAMTCAFDIPKGCLRQSQVTTDILPSVDKVVDGTYFLCHHMSDLNLTCTQNMMWRMQQCAVEKVFARLLTISLTDIAAITCVGFQVAYDCMKETLGACGERTLQINLQYINEYVRPPACRTFDPAGVDYTTGAPGSTASPRTSTRSSVSVTTDPMSVTTGPMSVTTGPVSVTSDPESDSQRVLSIFRSKLRQCLEHEGVPQISREAATKFSYSVPFNQTLTEMACSDKQQYMRMFACVREVSKPFLFAEVADSLPSLSSVETVLDDLCDYAARRYTNFTCAAAKMADLKECTLQKSRLNRDEEGTRKMCGGWLNDTECLREIMYECGCRTSQLYVNVFKELKPVNCPDILVPTPMCASDTGNYLYRTGDNGVAPLHGVSATALAMFVVVVFGFLMSF